MALVLNEEQRLLQDTAREFLDSNAPVAALRKLRDARDPLGYAPDLWQQMAEWAGPASFCLRHMAAWNLAFWAWAWSWKRPGAP